MDGLILKAARFAAEKHRDQKRKVSGRAYIEHPIRVAGAVAIRPHATEVMVAAAFLHDVIEDCGVSHEALAREFGFEVADLVKALSKPPLSEGNREWRQGLFRHQVKAASPDAWVIKLVDRLDNLREMAGMEPDFLKLYCRESREWVGALRSSVLWDLEAAILAEVEKLEGK